MTTTPLNSTPTCRLPFSLFSGVGFSGFLEGFFYVCLHFVAANGGRVAQYGFRVRIYLLGRKEHQPPKLGVEGSNPSPPAIINVIFLSFWFSKICAPVFYLRIN